MEYYLIVHLACLILISRVIHIGIESGKLNFSDHPERNVPFVIVVVLFAPVIVLVSFFDYLRKL